MLSGILLKTQARITDLLEMVGMVKMVFCGWLWRNQQQSHIFRFPHISTSSRENFSLIICDSTSTSSS
ncbi:hypothetical protein Hanom_Chr16g01506561 [Helianthus anomalus]